jgi:deoxyribodipyrimidine photo-lyase
MNHRDQSDFENLIREYPKDQFRVFEEATLYPEAELPFSLSDLPKTFTPFQKKVEILNPRIPAPLASPVAIHPSLKDPVVLNGRRMEFQGGESAGLQQLRSYLREGGPVDRYSETRNGLLRVEDSSKLSPYLAQGCISARQVHHALLSREQETGVNAGTRALRYELQWRDYFKFLSLQSGAKLFEPAGLKDSVRESTPDRELFQKWTSGETGDRFLDANLLELNETGWMSNRGRQNVASHFAKILKLPWLWGAEWFEQNLIDHDVETNQGNWMYLAGVGTDPRDRVFNAELQAANYDPDGEYRKRWSSR